MSHGTDHQHDPQPGAPSPQQRPLPKPPPYPAPYPQPRYGEPGYGHRPYEQRPYERPSQGIPPYGPTPQPVWPAPPPVNRRSDANPDANHRGLWLPVTAIALMAGLLASGGTAAAIELLDEDSSASSIVASATDESNEPAPQGPVDNTVGTPDWIAVAEALQDSVVAIGARSQFGGGEGSGVVIDDEGHIVTNHHVVAGALDGGEVTVTLADGTVVDAEIVGTDPSTDLAVLIVANTNGLEPITIGDSDAVVVGQPVMAAGNPLGLSDTITTGIVSATDRPVTTQRQGGPASTAGQPVVTNAIQTDAAINPGNSGGALVDATGALIGINSSIASLGGPGGQAGSIGLGFAIPVNVAEAVAEQLISEGAASQTFLGVSLATGVVQDGDVGRQAAVVGEIVPGTPAEESGLQPEDAVIAVEDEPVSGAESLTAQVRERRPGDQLTLEVLRDGERLDVEVTLGERPQQ